MAYLSDLAQIQASFCYDIIPFSNLIITYTSIALGIINQESYW